MSATTLKAIFLLSLFSVQLSACTPESDYKNSKTFMDMNNAQSEDKQDTGTDTATFGAGCFWCVEAQFQQLEGVTGIESGYSGGTVANPTYHQVGTGATGHAEVVNIYYDPTKITFDELLAAFWVSHDPTQLNKQGNDVGTQYRSIVLYHNEEQKQKAEEYKRRLNEEKAYHAPVVTEIAPFTAFYKAEDYHQNYYNDNSSQPYCTFVIQPKLEKFKKVFKDKLKEK